ncbi:MAG TPA: hypothetical protein VE377_03060 [Candidatus Dormibacteraeota bacterium]|nr:hypothetical protein [Candidatus Dormibacteraeota bacterium]
MKIRRKLSVGDWVEVRSKAEILKTLDAKGQLDGMPFMPEMFRYCGQSFQVFKRAHKTCDYTTPYPYRSRRLEGTVHLETRCDGEAHAGCQAGCLLYWKEAWLKPISDPRHVAALKADTPAREQFSPASSAGCSESDVWVHTQVSDPSGPPTYVCQVTRVPYASQPLAWWDQRQYFEDYWSGNVSLGRLFSSLIYSIYYNLSQAGIGLGPAMRWFYNKFYPFWGGSPFPRNPGVIPQGAPTPSETLNLQPGELVRVKSQEEILRTVDNSNRNRGMYWDAELVPYCGGTYRVLRRVTRLIDEKTAKMVELKNPCIILDTVVCQARFSSCRMLCPKSMYPYWREIWLERVVPNASQTTPNEEATGTTATRQ